MDSLCIKVNDIKNNLIEKNIKAIQKEKLKPIKNIEEDENILKEYNYYVKLSKRIKKYIRKNDNIYTIFKVKKDKEEKIVYIVVSIKMNEMSIGIPIDIRLITGSKNETYMDCTYYERTEYGILYINDFRSSIYNQGYGGILLKNLDNIIKEINTNFKINKLKSIKNIEGHLIPNKNIISEIDLRHMYIKYEFEIDDDNNIKREIDKIVTYEK